MMQIVNPWLINALSLGPQHYAPEYQAYKVKARGEGLINQGYPDPKSMENNSLLWVLGHYPYSTYFWGGVGRHQYFRIHVDKERSGRFFALFPRG